MSFSAKILQATQHSTPQEDEMASKPAVPSKVISDHDKLHTKLLGSGNSSSLSEISTRSRTLKITPQDDASRIFRPAMNPISLQKLACAAVIRHHQA
jgi:hypothetical protein